MQPVLVVTGITDVSLALLRLIVQKGMRVHVITDNIAVWKQTAPDLFTAGNSFAENAEINFTPQYVVIEPLSALSINSVQLFEKLVNSKVVSVFRSATEASGYPSLVFPQANVIKETLSATDKAEEIMKSLFSFGGNTTLYMVFTKFIIETHTAPLKTEKPKVDNASPKKINRKVLIALIILFLIMLPFALLGLATVLSLAGAHLMVNGDMALARTSFQASEKIASLTSTIPIQRVAASGVHGTYAVENTNKIVKGIFGEEQYPIDDLSQSLKYNLQAIYRELSFLDAELGDKDNFIMRFMPVEELKKIRKATEAGTDIAGRLPYLLGRGEQKTYMVLLQNNMELRPTGGFIGSFALVHFAEGKLLDAPVYDVYSADGQLKGYVKPPEPIRDYLGEASWYLRDSNWDPDFQISAERAKWFLDKSLGIPVDGVVAIDLEFMRGLIASQGSLEIPDFEMALTADNFYEIIQNEVHKDFFPGSRKKAAVLTAAMNVLMSNVLQDVNDKDLSLASVALNSLSAKHVQVHLDDPVSQDWVNVLGWAGEATPNGCIDNCEEIWLGLVEANVGVNKANYFIERRAEMETRWVAGDWEHKVTTYIKNTASGNGVAEEHDYTAYVRLLAPLDVNFDKVIIENNGRRKSLAPEITTLNTRKEAGVLAEVPAGTETKITFTWIEEARIDLNSPGRLQLYWRKQAGVAGFPITAKIRLPQSSLTGEGSFEYNSNLQEDFTTEIIW